MTVQADCPSTASITNSTVRTAPGFYGKKISPLTQELFPSVLWRTSAPGLHFDLQQKQLLKPASYCEREESKRGWKGSEKRLVILDLVYGCQIKTQVAEPNSQMSGTPVGIQEQGHPNGDTCETLD